MGEEKMQTLYLFVTTICFVNKHISNPALHGDEPPVPMCLLLVRIPSNE